MGDLTLLRAESGGIGNRLSPVMKGNKSLSGGGKTGLPKIRMAWSHHTQGFEFPADFKAKVAFTCSVYPEDKRVLLVSGEKGTRLTARISDDSPERRAHGGVAELVDAIYSLEIAGNVCTC